MTADALRPWDVGPAVDAIDSNHEGVTAMEDRLQWGILGTGMIGKVFAKALAKSDTGDLLAVGSRKQGTADAFGGEFAVPRRYGSYEDLLADTDVGAVYVSLPNHMHLEWTAKCAEAGKHVLCEKPLTLNAPEAEDMLRSVGQHDVFLMEAFMYRCHPQTTKLVELVRAGTVGEVRLIQAHFGYNLGGRGSPHENIRMRNEVGGGAIMDVGCYTVSMARLMAGAASDLDQPLEPQAVSGVAHIGEISRVDEWATAVLRFPGDILANVSVGNMCSIDATLRIWGSEGNIQVPNPWFPGRAADTEVIHVKRDGAEVEEVRVPAQQGRLYTIEADTVARWIPQRQAPSPCMTWQDSLGNMRVLDRWRASVGLTFDPEQA